MKRVICFLLALLLIYSINSSLAQIPRVINYQGVLLGSNEQPVPEANYKLTFSLYREDGTQLWTEAHDPVFIAGGTFHVHLGIFQPLDLPFNEAYFLGIKVGNDPELQPRMMLTGAAYSLNADMVGGIIASEMPAPNTLCPLGNDGKFPATVLPAIATGNFLKKNEPDTSRGTVAAPMLLVSNQGDGDGINGRNISGKGRGVVGRSDNNDGVVGWSGASDKSGVFGHSDDGWGVTGRSDKNYGVQGLSANNDGVYGESLSNNKSGVYGHHSDSGNGVFGGSQNGVGVKGVSVHSDGVVCESYSNNANHAALRASNRGTGPAILAEGRTVTKVLEITGGADLSEQFDVVMNRTDGVEASSEQCQPGMVVSIDQENPGKLVVCRQAYDRKVAGIISGAGGLQPGMLMSQSGSMANGKYPVALTGRVYCLADASSDAIQVGDLLTTSDTPGYAMKVSDYAKAQGAIIGKAMSLLDKGKGLVLVLVTLQ